MILCLLLGACAAPPQRPAASSYGCMTAVRDGLPAGLPDARAHCLASGWIAQRCSRVEAYLAALGKEVRDLFDGGNAQWSDWRADRAGLRCAKQGQDADLAACCAMQGY